MAVTLYEWKDENGVVSAAMDSDGNLLPIGLVDGVDIAALKAQVDAIVAGNAVELFTGNATSGNIELSQPIDDFLRIEFIAIKTQNNNEVYSMTVYTPKIPISGSQSVEIVGSGASQSSHIRMFVQPDLTTVAINQNGGVALVSVVGWN